jgi:hypothetical protein
LVEHVVVEPAGQEIGAARGIKSMHVTGFSSNVKGEPSAPEIAARNLIG